MTAQPAPLICPSCGAPNDGRSSVCPSCSFVLAPVPQVHAGFVLASRYEITCALGAGGMGIVYQAQDRLLQETVALKVLRPEVAATPEMAQRFISEIKMARAVSHRNVCRIHEYGEDRGLRYISMAFVGGVDLRRILRERGALPPGLAFEVAIQTTEGLEAVHREGIVHRDLKPANITLDPRGVVRVMDFGLAKQSTQGADLSSGSAGHMVGTPEYMSPEQIRGAKLDRRSDVYSMAVVAYELFTGRTPFRADTPVVTILKHLNEPPPLDGVEALPPAVVPVLKKALQKEPDHRYSTAEDLGHALDEARSATPGADQADFEALFRGREAGGPADSAQASPASWSGTQDLSQATWTTAVGRKLVEAVEAEAAADEAIEALSNEPVLFQAVDDHEAETDAPFFVEDVAAARSSVDPIEAPVNDRANPPRDDPAAAVALAQALAAFTEHPVPSPEEPRGVPAPSEPEEVGIEVTEPEVPAEPAPPPAASAAGPSPDPASAPAPNPGAAPASAPAGERQRVEDSPGVTTLAGRARGTAARSARPPWERLAGLVRANPRYALIAAAIPAVALVTAGLLRLVAAPQVSSAEPTRVANGGSVVLNGTDFSGQADGVEVLFSGHPGRVTATSPTRLTVELPELDFSWPEPERRVPVVVHVGRRRSAAFDLTVYQIPRIRSLSPETGLPGDEVTLYGSGWPLSATVRFGRIDAQVLAPGYKSITVRVPAVRPGASGVVPVIVVAGQTASSPVKFRIGRAQP